MKTKKKLQFVLFFISLIVIFGACSGDEGPTGPIGDTGPEGAVGQVGPAGADGSVLYSGTDDPSTSTGQDGDYYLNTASGELFGPKTSGEWSDSFMLKGEDGVAGNTILSGTETPDQATGLDGDFYLDIDDILLYGPKVSDAWGAGLELKGADGNANVKSYALTILATDWEKVAYVASTVFSEKVLFPALTSDTYEEGAVLIYQKETTRLLLNSETTYTLLPLTEIMELGGVRSLRCDIIKNVKSSIPVQRPFTTYSLNFIYQFAWVVGSNLSDDLTFKIVLIEGESAVLAKTLQDQGLVKIAAEIGFTL